MVKKKKETPIVEEVKIPIVEKTEPKKSWFEAMQEKITNKK